MSQRRICEYLGLSCTHHRSLLCLSPAVRHRIYCAAGLITDSDIDLDRRANADSWPPSADFELSYNLLLSCRTVYAEASSILYSTNRFFIRYRYSRSLRALRNLTAGSLSYLTHLTVHLNVTSCEIGEPCCMVYPGESRSCREHDKPLRTSSRQHRAILSEWQSTATHARAHIAPSSLRLHFLCDVEDLEAAVRAVEPLLSIPTLLDCNIRLSRHPDPPLQDLARKTATRATGYRADESCSSFPFLDLPQELRWQILEYTDLVTPLCEIEWNSRGRFFLRYSTWGCGSIWDCPSDLHHACHFRNCWQYANVGCFCRRYHAAFSSKCHCWSPPTSLFLVCRPLLEDARAVFFMRNRFVITPSGGCNRPAESTPSRIEASIFLTDVVPSNALRFLRFLEVVFPPFDKDYLRPQEPAYQDWLQTIDHIKEKLHLPMLTLRVYMADHLPNGQGVTPFRNKMTKEQGIKVLKMYARSLVPLSKLRGLNRFFAHLAWPFAWTQQGRRRRQENPESVQQEIVKMEQRFERIVMGNYYNSMSLGKKEQTNSQWLEELLGSIEYGVSTELNLY